MEQLSVSSGNEVSIAVSSVGINSINLTNKY